MRSWRRIDCFTENLTLSLTRETRQIAGGEPFLETHCAKVAVTWYRFPVCAKTLRLVLGLTRFLLCFEFSQPVWIFLLSIRLQFLRRWEVCLSATLTNRSSWSSEALSVIRRLIAQKQNFFESMLATAIKWDLEYVLFRKRAVKIRCDRKARAWSAANLDEIKL